jgi:hypothetical protein
MPKDTTEHPARSQRIAVRVSEGELRVMLAEARRQRCSVSTLVRAAVAEMTLGERVKAQRT